MKHPFEQRISALLERRASNNTLRRLPVRAMQGVDFASNDYLGLSLYPIPALNETPENNFSGVQKGATGSRLLTGNWLIYSELETLLADFYHAPAALLFNSGYDANLGLLSACVRKTDMVLCDALVHASIHDGLKLAGVQAEFFPNNRLDILATLLARPRPPEQVVWVIVESVYSMDGTVCPLPALVRLCETHNALIILDEAHSTGIFGQKGQGLAVEMGVETQIWARLHTFGKAMGAHGAVILGSELLKDYLTNYARSLIYTTALPPETVQHLKTTHDLFGQTVVKNRQQQLWENIQFWQKAAENMPTNWFSISQQNSPIQTIQIQPNQPNQPNRAQATKKLAEFLQSKNFQIFPILSPTVQAGEERLRVCLHSFNQFSEIEQLFGFLTNFPV